MSRIKNQYLLAAIAVLGALSAVTCLALVFKEDGNGRKIDQLRSNLSDTGEQRSRAEKQLNEQLTGLDGRLKEEAATRRQLADESTRAQRQAEKTVEANLKTTQGDLKKLSEKLAKAQNDLAKTQKDLKELQEQVKK